MRGSSMPDIGDFNEKLVLQTIRRAGDGISQADVVRGSGLSRQAVSLITRRLLERGVVEQAGTRASGPGKPATILQIRPMSLWAAGVHIDPWAVTITCVDLLARPFSRLELDPPTDHPLADIERIAEALTRLRAEVSTKAGPSELLGVGITAPAGLDANSGVIRGSPWLDGWQDVPIAHLVASAVGAPATLEKDTIAALTAERWVGDVPSQEADLYIYAGTGVGSAVASGSHVNRGVSGQAGEVGHLPIGLGTDRCGCGRFGCLCLYTDVPVILARARDRGGLVGPKASTELEGLERLAVEASRAPGVERDLIQTYGNALGMALSLLVGIHDPQRIIIGGPSWHALEKWAMPSLRERAFAESRHDDRPEIESSTLGNDVAAIGAAALILDSELSPGALGEIRR